MCGAVYKQSSVTLLSVHSRRTPPRGGGTVEGGQQHSREQGGETYKVCLFEFSDQIYGFLRTPCCSFQAWAKKKKKKKRKNEKMKEKTAKNKK